MDDRSPIRRFIDGRDEVARYYPHAAQKVILSRDVLANWRGLDAGSWRSEGWEDAAEIAPPGLSDDDFRRALERRLAVAEVQVVEAPPDYLAVAPV